MSALRLRQRQGGSALLAVLALAVLAASYAYYRYGAIFVGDNEQRSQVITHLGRAKEALIAYAALDSTRPGRLPCPSLNTDGNVPTFLGEDCPSYKGLLPWKTLDLELHTDNQGTTFHYIITPGFGGDHTGQSLNSDTAPSLRLDTRADAPSNDMVAVIIAVRGQLDQRNGDDDSYYFNGDQAGTDDDLIVGISRQELMAAVEARIANELRTCLVQHAAQSGSFPWPAPLASAIVTQVTYNDANNSSGTFQTNKGLQAALFGQVPDTQAGNPQEVLQATLQSILSTKTQLIQSPVGAPASTQLARALQSQVAYAMSLFNQFFLSAVNLESSARTALRDWITLDAWLDSVTTTKTTYINNATALPGKVSIAQPSLISFRESLANSGFDLFLNELSAQDQKLTSLIDGLSRTTGLPSQASLSSLLDEINIIKNGILDNSTSSEASIETAIGNAYATATIAASAARLATQNRNSDTVSQAITSAQNLLSSNQLIASAIQRQRTQGSGNSNVTLSTLDTLIEVYAHNMAGSPANVTLARSFSDAIQPVNYWTQRAIGQAADLATLARRGIVSGTNADGQAIGKIALSDSANSAFTLANQFLNSLDGVGKTIPLLQAAESGSPQQMLAAQAALQSSLAILNNGFLPLAAQLAASFNTSTARGVVPTVWFGNACAFLRPLNSQGTWWSQGDWRKYFFYQISGAAVSSLPTLSVNGQGSYRVVTLAAGRPLSFQDRRSPETRQYLEGSNADTSRDGLATAPTTRFSTQAVSATFNDHLAY